MLEISAGSTPDSAADWQRLQPMLKAFIVDLGLQFVHRELDKNH
jgi:hypothetical protein